MKIPSEIFALVGVGCLASIQIRRVIKGELPLFGLKQISAASKIKIDTFDIIMVLAAAISFIFLFFRTLGT